MGALGQLELIEKLVQELHSLVPPALALVDELSWALGLLVGQARTYSCIPGVPGELSTSPSPNPTFRRSKMERIEQKRTPRMPPTKSRRL